ncbi:PHD and RING finger domain-containing protein 1 isoform X2 [Parambassis ranga]|uniref:PHD and RING finger domain-containing protein 1 isoform X2 n=1 Tax=Parambassis ranga TaxID=210632 RepID=A0A6P7I6V0_9TELE|nr:PHD and RING finger domain-containing protein 1 isoform X2 [Parambassis ranga]
MDEDDSQEEPINRSTSHSKGKRAALWAISDDSDDIEEESEEGESDSGQEGEDDDGEDEEEEEEEEGNEEEDDEEEEEDVKAEDEACVGTSADLAGMSSDEDSEKCPICLNSFNSQPVATPENCEHYFCFDCILEWAKNANSCPVDRLTFNSVYLRKSYGGKVKKIITVQKPVKEGQEETVDLDLEQTNCEVCGGSDREDRLLLCDGCDAGYHMECLTPPLHSVPVEEWFCPECEPNSHQSRRSAEEVSDTDNVPSTARSATRRSQPHGAGPTRAIARTQQSERVRANVNRHRITQLAPTYMMQSTWLDETINAVVAGLNTAVYVRDFIPRIPTSRRRKTGRRRKVKRKKTSSANGKTGNGASTGVRRKKRKVRRTKSRKKMILKKTATPRSRIANNLGIVKGKKSSSLPTVYRPAEHTLSNMRADIGAASLSIYGDPFDLDPFVDRVDDDQQAHATSQLEAKRRGISQSALRSHQPVARPVTASLSSRGMDVPHANGVVESAPIPDLLGSILSGQSILMMDSSDVVINRDGSLKATKPITVTPSVLMAGTNTSTSSGDGSSLNSPGMSPSPGDSTISFHYNDLAGSSHSSRNRLLSQSSSHAPPFMDSSASHFQLSPHSDVLPRERPSLLPSRPHRPNPSLGHRGANGIGVLKDTASIFVHQTPDLSSKRMGLASVQTQPIKAPTKPMWVDVSVLPRIPKVKRDIDSVTNNDASQGGSNRNSNNRRGSSYSLPNMGINTLSGGRGRQQSVDKQKGQGNGQAQRPRPDRPNSSAAFSTSFASSSSSSSSSPASQPQCSSSSSAVSFRINSSGNSWHSRRLSIASSSVSEGSMQKRWKEKEDEARKRQLHRNKQMLLTSRSLASKEQDSNNMYDPFNPTLSDSSSSDEEAERTSLESSSQHDKHERKPPSSQGTEGLNVVQLKTETQEIKQEAQEAKCSERYVKVEKDSSGVDIKIEKQTLLHDVKVKKESDLDDTEESERSDDRLGNSLNLSLDPSKTKRKFQAEEGGHCSRTPNRSFCNYKDDPSPSSSASSMKKQIIESKSESASCPKSPLRDLGQKKKTSKALTEQQSSNSEKDRGRGDYHTSGQKEKDKRDKERSSRRSSSRERQRRANSTSDSSLSSSPDRTHRRRPRSQSKGGKRKRRSRSGSRSSSRERTRRKNNKRRSIERSDDRARDKERKLVSKDKRHGRSHSKSQSKSRSRSRTRSRSKDRKRDSSCSKSRSRSRERKRDQTKPPHLSLSHRDKVESQSKDKSRHKSRSSSRERMKEDRFSKSSQKTSGSGVSSKDTKRLQNKKKETDITRSLTPEAVAKVKKQELLSSFLTSKVKKEEEGSQHTVTEIAKEKLKKEIKKEKQTLDMFEDSPIIKPIKKEETDDPSLAVSLNKDEDIKVSIKTESSEVTIFKSEPSPLEVSHVPLVTSFSTVTTAVTTDSLQDTVSEAHPASVASLKQNTVSIKQEPPSDSEDDFNVDVMLDNLDYEKSKLTEGIEAAVKQDLLEGQEEPETVSTLAGAKSKTQVKRVTWNIQEHEGPQPEKSASKLALYKLKLKQEGARRPSFAGQTCSQRDIPGPLGDPSLKGLHGQASTSSKVDGFHPGELSTTAQGESEEGDSSGKDKYLKKLHMQERAIEEVKLAIKPFYQRRDINKDEYKEILRKAVQKVCHSKSGEINPVKVGNLVKAYVDKYKHARKHKKEENLGKVSETQNEAMKT